MKKAVDVIKRTLEKDKKDFITVCKISEGFSIIFYSLCIMCVIAIAIMAILSAIMKKGGEMFGSPEGIIVMVIDVLTLITYIVALNFSVKIFNKLKSGDTPFRYDIADKIKGAGTALIVGSLAGELIIFVKNILIDTGVIEDVETFDIFASSGNVIFGVVLMALAYIFNYGCKLQQESDETV